MIFIEVLIIVINTFDNKVIGSAFMFGIYVVPRADADWCFTVTFVHMVG